MICQRFVSLGFTLFGFVLFDLQVCSWGQLDMLKREMACDLPHG